MSLPVAPAGVGVGFLVGLALWGVATTLVPEEVAGSAWVFFPMMLLAGGAGVGGAMLLARPRWRTAIGAHPTATSTTLVLYPDRLAVVRRRRSDPDDVVAVLPRSSVQVTRPVAGLTLLVLRAGPGPALRLLYPRSASEQAGYLVEALAAG